MTPARILIFTASHLWRNPRVVKEAATLSEVGHHVTILTLRNDAEFDVLDRDLLRGRPFQRVFLDQLGMAGVGRRGLTWAARKLLRFTNIECPQALGPATALLRMARSLPADLIIAHTEIPLWAASRLIREGLCVAVDMEDWYSEDLMPADRAMRPLALLRRAEKFALRHASYVSTTSSEMAAALTAAYGGRQPIVIRNTFPLQPDPLYYPNPEPRIVWFSQTIGPGRGLEDFLVGWSRCAHPSLITLIGSVRQNYRDELVRCVPESRRARIEFLPPIPPRALPEKLAEFDIGLALEPPMPRNRDLTISNKLFQYLNAGLALLATNTSGQSEVLRAAPGCGLSVRNGDPARIAACLDELLSEPSRLARCRKAARAAAEAEFRWEVDAQRLIAAVQRALGENFRPSATSE